jgi:hypothetical protein
MLMSIPSVRVSTLSRLGIVPSFRSFADSHPRCRDRIKEVFPTNSRPQTNNRGCTSGAEPSASNLRSYIECLSDFPTTAAMSLSTLGVRIMIPLPIRKMETI